MNYILIKKKRTICFSISLLVWVNSLFVWNKFLCEVAKNFFGWKTLFAFFYLATDGVNNLFCFGPSSIKWLQFVITRLNCLQLLNNCKSCSVLTLSTSILDYKNPNFENNDRFCNLVHYSKRCLISLITSGDWHCKKSKRVFKQVLGTFWLYIMISVSNSKVETNNRQPISKNVKK